MAALEFESGHKGAELEAMLLRWANTSTGGPQIVLQLASVDDLEPFMAMTLAKGKIAGQRLKIVYVEIGDQEQEKLAPDSPPGKGGSLSVLAARWCQDPEFQSWLDATYPNNAFDPEVDESEEAHAAKMVRALCAINSRRELDHKLNASQLFEAHFRRPYMKHLQEGPRFHE